MKKYKFQIVFIDGSEISIIEINSKKALILAMAEKIKKCDVFYPESIFCSETKEFKTINQNHFNNLFLI